MPRTKQTRRSVCPSQNDILSALIVSKVQVSRVLTPSTPPLSKKRCLYVCRWISKACNYHLFAQPVDWQALGLLDYPNIVQQPMDFTTLTTYISSFEDDDFNFSDFLDKSRLIWANACMYNPSGHPVNSIAQRLANEFENKMTQMQSHADNDDPTNIANQLQSLILGLQDKDYSELFIHPIDLGLCASYAEYVNVPYCLQYILDDLCDLVYSNRNDVQDDVNLVVKNAILYNSEKSFVGIAAKTLKEVSERLFQSRLPELDTFYFISSYMRHQLIENITTITDNERLEIMSDIATHCPDALTNTASTASFSVDMLSRKQFICIDSKVRRMLPIVCVRS